jgi:predicted MPP superfamily phosphohydrolase
MVLSINRRRFLTGVAAVSAVGVIGVGADAFTAGAHDLAIEQIEIRSSRVPPAFDGFTIAQLSDFHYDP